MCANITATLEPDTLTLEMTGRPLMIELGDDRIELSEGQVVLPVRAPGRP